YRLPNRSRDNLAAAGHACAARRAEEHRSHDLERLFAGPRRGARPRPARRGLPACVEPTFDLGYQVVDHEPLIVLMPSDHRLTAREAVRPQDFVGEIFI